MVCEKYELCQKLCSLYPTQGACFHHAIKKCHGACITEESAEVYNKRIDDFLNSLNFNGESFYIIDKGRHKSEKSLVLIEKGKIIGYGYAPYHFQGQAPYRWRKFIEDYQEDRDARTIVQVYLRKNSSIDKVPY